MDNEIVNLSYLIESSLNDEEYVKMMIDMYIKNTPDYLDNFTQLLQDENFEELKRLAHKFKASVTIMGIEPVTTIIENLENNIAKGIQLDQLPQMIDDIKNYCTKSVVILQGIIDSETPLCK